jgi:VIT1/CCC1 family predicted Fe2+/Mn2+ transporter
MAEHAQGRRGEFRRIANRHRTAIGPSRAVGETGSLHIGILFASNLHTYGFGRYVPIQLCLLFPEPHMTTILLIILILLLLGALPAWPYSRNWGYAPTGGLGTILVIVLILVLLGRL